MLWIEMSRDRSRPEDEWGLGRSLWSPTEKSDGSSWSFWDNLLRVEEDDVVLHLVGDDDPAFVGHSVAEDAGYVTRSRPTDPDGQYDHAETFHRAHLRDFTPLEEEFPIGDLFARHREEIVGYYESNRERSRSEKRSILPVVQGGRLQCLNGAYLTEVEGRFRELVLSYVSGGGDTTTRSGPSPRPERGPNRDSHDSVPTGSRNRSVKQRVGQKKFRDNVLDNWDGCCFPGCEVDDSELLVGAHIARWADNPELRGDLQNGLCLCLMHDKAFEKGMFTLDPGRTVWTTEKRVSGTEWAEENIWPHVGESIDDAPTMPGDEPLLKHWTRVDLDPIGN
ncbi:HNH endonuclease [Salinibacter ruber]|uniref:HNH endonuclease n=1 Tax=Salinibacter ruber TaxID=146919 RepID=UPI002166D6CD|nr:HNH endonuclease [Salinibacter ruber]MCS3782682.1 hypothetical protein [Salinibacter ruber]